MGKDEQPTRSTAALSPATPGRASSQEPDQDFSALRGRVLVGRYELDREIGLGGFGVVFGARDRRLDKRVAIKILTPNALVKPRHLARFKQEATAAARIGHKNIVDVTDFDEDEDGTHFMVMEFISGRDLRRVNREEGPLPLARALSIAAQIADALAAAHSRSIIHRDLKPANIMLTNVGPVADFVKVLDFGISKITSTGDSSDSDTDTMTEAGRVLGTPKYMAPEQGMGNKEIDGRADIYALGTILYEMVTHRLPYTGATSYEIIHNKVSRDPLPPSVVNTELEHGLDVDRLVLEALARDADDRFSTMAAFEQAIQNLLESVDPAVAAVVGPDTPSGELRDHGFHSASTATLATKVEPAAVPHAKRTASARRRSRWLLAGLGAAVAAAAIAVGIVATGSDPAPAETPRPALPTRSPAVEPSPSPVEDTVEIQLAIEPESATVEIDGVAVHDNPLKLPQSDRVYTLVVRAPGFVSQQREIRPVADGAVEVTLEPEPVAPKKRPRPRRRSRLPDSPL